MEGKLTTVGLTDVMAGSVESNAFTSSKLRGINWPLLLNIDTIPVIGLLPFVYGLPSKDVAPLLMYTVNELPFTLNVCVEAASVFSFHIPAVSIVTFFTVTGIQT